MASINQSFSNAITLDDLLSVSHMHHLLTCLYILSVSCFSFSLSTLCLRFVRAVWQITVAPVCEMLGDVGVGRLRSHVNLTLAVAVTYITTSPVYTHGQLLRAEIHVKLLFSKWCGFVTFERKRKASQSLKTQRRSDTVNVASLYSEDTKCH